MFSGGRTDCFAVYLQGETTAGSQSRGDRQVRTRAGGSQGESAANMELSPPKGETGRCKLSLVRQVLGEDLPITRAFRRAHGLH